jgi:hypothetical protein
VAQTSSLRFQNSSPITITNFTDGAPGQVVQVFNDGLSTITFQTSNTNGIFLPAQGVGGKLVLQNGESARFFLSPRNGRWVAQFDNGEFLAFQPKVLMNCGTLTTSASASDSIPCSWVTEASACAVTPSNAISASLSYFTVSSGSVAVHHAPVAGATFSIACSAK